MFLVWYFVLLHISSRHQLFSFHLLMPNDKIDFMTWAILDWKHWIYHWFLSRVYAKYFIQIFCIFWGSRILSLGRFHNVIYVPLCPSVGQSVGRLVCHNFFKGRGVRLQCSYKSTLKQGQSFIYLSVVSFSIF